MVIERSHIAPKLAYWL